MVVVVVALCCAVDASGYGWRLGGGEICARAGTDGSSVR